MSKEIEEDLQILAKEIKRFTDKHLDKLDVESQEKVVLSVQLLVVTVSEHLLSTPLGGIH